MPEDFELFDAGCIKVKVPVVIGEKTQQKLLDNVVALTEGASKITDVQIELRNLDCEVIDDKVIVQGIIHKELFFKTRKDNFVHHHSENIPFSDLIEIPGARVGMQCTFAVKIKHVRNEQISTCRIREKIVIETFVKVTDERQIMVEECDNF